VAALILKYTARPEPVEGHGALILRRSQYERCGVITRYGLTTSRRRSDVMAPVLAPIFLTSLLNVLSMIRSLMRWRMGRFAKSGQIVIAKVARRLNVNDHPARPEPVEGRSMLILRQPPAGSQLER
jgi:hypothetical protein